MKRLAGIAFSLAATSLSLATDDSNAPLANAKQELKQLQRDQAVQKTGAADEKLKSALPKFHPPTPGQPEADPSSPASPVRQESERRRQAIEGSNWLLEGYNRLDPKNSAPRGKRAARKIDPNADEREQLRPGDVGYMLRLYEKQTREAAGAENRPGETLRHSLASAPTDPLAPYLKDWLANSPVRDVALDAVGRRDPTALPEGSSPADEASRGATLSPNPSSPLGFDQPARGRNPAENPFLSALAPIQPGGLAGGGSHGQAPPAAGFGTPAASTAQGSLAVRPEPPSLRRPDTRKPPPSQREEDRKYFPQLKRF
jgi:hypothetical protein